MPNYLTDEKYFIQSTSPKSNTKDKAKESIKGEKVVEKFKKKINESQYRRTKAKSRIIGYVKK